MASADPIGVRHYRGETSAGGSFAISTTVRDGVVRLRHLSLEATATCEDGTSFDFAGSIGFGDRGPRLDGTHLDEEHVFFDMALFVAGRLGAHRGTGTTTQLFASLDRDENPQLCSTGELSWEVGRVSRPGAEAPMRRAVTRVVGDVTTTITPGSIQRGPRAPAPRIRTYEGRLSSRDPLFVITQKRPEGVSLLELGFGWNLGCDDGSAIGLGFFILFSNEPLPPGRLDYDLPPQSGNFALHIHGRLGIHAGSGTTSTTLAALTEDLQAQACRTGDLTWRAWRTDAGARPA